jgi:hypothetical protein
VSAAPAVAANGAEASFGCGPLDVRVHAPETLFAKIAETLRLYDLRWEDPLVRIDVFAERAATESARAGGSTLQCARMNVDASNAGVYASTRSGASARQSAAGSAWHVEVPDALIAAGALEELEDIVSLVLTEGWRAAGWVPIHGAAVVRAGRCAIVCAATGGGKTTLTASLVRSGWRTLGDDKLLLRMHDGRPELAALLHTFNLHPRTHEWFPEVGTLEHLPRYSAWTEKRKVRAKTIWPEMGALRAQPTRLVLLERSTEHRDVRTRELQRTEIFETLLRQTVIPRDPRRAAPILKTAAATCSRITGVRLEIGSDAYADPDCGAAIERAVFGEP